MSNVGTIAMASALILLGVWAVWLSVRNLVKWSRAGETMPVATECVARTDRLEWGESLGRKYGVTLRWRDLEGTEREKSFTVSERLYLNHDEITMLVDPNNADFAEIEQMAGSSRGWSLLTIAFGLVFVYIGGNMLFRLL